MKGIACILVSVFLLAQSSVPEDRHGAKSFLKSKLDKVIDVLRNMERFGKFRPSRNDPLHGWWVSLSDKGDD